MNKPSKLDQIRALGQGSAIQNRQPVQAEAASPPLRLFSVKVGERRSGARARPRVVIEGDALEALNYTAGDLLIVEARPDGLLLRRP